MDIQLIRHATLLVQYNGATILVDPMFSPAGALDALANTANPVRNPTVNLNVSVEHCLKADAVLVTHTHRDHFDDAAISLLPKDMLLFCQPEDRDYMIKLGFTRIVPIDTEHEWQGIRFSRTGGQHGSGTMAVRMGPVSGFVLEAEGEKKLYIAGDTLWCDEVSEALRQHKPDVIVLFAGGAEFLAGGPITMTQDDIREVRKNAPEAEILIAHMEAWGHCALTRDKLRQYAETHHLRIQIPEDGDTIRFR